MSAHVPAEEDFLIWREHPVTRFVFAGLLNLAAQAEAKWKEEAWLAKPAFTDVEARGREVERQRITTRIEAYTDLAALNFADALGANGIDPKEAESAK